MQPKAPLKLNEQVYQEACEWFVEFRSGDLDDAGRRRFDLWARKSPEHLAAYLEIAAIWSEGAALDPDLRWDPQALIAQAAADAGNVVPFTDPSRTADASIVVSGMPSQQAPDKLGTQRSRPVQSLLPGFRIAASIAAAGLIIGTTVWYQNFRMPIYATAFGEQRSISLTDGSVIDINSHSKIRVRYSARERDVDLLEGQALFHVAKNPTRPFLVSSATTQVRAVGTEFDVYQKQGGTVVSVVEGRVAVLLRSETADSETTDLTLVTAAHPDESGARQPSRGRAPILLAAGEQVFVTTTAMQKADHPNIAIATSWTQRQLEFESASLSEVAEEFNRYNERQLVIEDPTLYDFHITGVFSSSDPASLVRFLRERPGVRVTETASEIRVSKNIL
jgi:transmembrane sensor